MGTVAKPPHTLNNDDSNDKTWRPSSTSYNPQALVPSELSFDVTEEDLATLYKKGKKLEGDDEALAERLVVREPVGGSKEGGAVLCLLGWNLSTMPQVERYESVYGCTDLSSVLLFCPTVGDTYGVDAACRITMRILEKIEPTSGPIIFHVFSGSCYIYIRLLVYMELFYSSMKERVVCSVFDSTPIDATAANGANAVVQGVPLPMPVYYVLLPVFWLYWNVVMPFNPWVAKWKNRFWEEIFVKPTFDAKLLFLYSNSDLIAPSDFIEEVAATAANNGVDVTLKCFTADSQLPPHCTHLLSFPEEYKESVELHLSRCGLASAPLASRL